MIKRIPRALWGFLERNSLGNQLLFTPNPPTYNVAFTASDCALAYIPALCVAPGAADNTVLDGTDVESAIDGGNAPDSNLVEDLDSPFPVVPCVFTPSQTNSPLLVVHFHGTGGDAHKSGQLWKDVAREMRERSGTDVAVLCVEYPGYGVFPGRPSEEACDAVAVIVLRYLLLACKLDPRQIIISGRSMGSGVACFAATSLTPRMLMRSSGTSLTDVLLSSAGDRDDPLSFLALVLISPFTSIHAVLDQFPASAVVKQLIRNRFDNESRMPLVPSSTGLFIYHGKRDALIPYTHAQQLYDVSLSKQRVLSLDPNGDHHSVPLAPSAMGSFVQTLPQTAALPVVLPERCFNVSHWHMILCRTEAVVQSQLLSVQVAVTAAVAVVHLRSKFWLRAGAVAWAALLLCGATAYSKKEEIRNRAGQSRGINRASFGMSIKVRVAVLTLLCRLLLPYFCLRNGGLETVAVGWLATHLLLS